MRLFRRLVRLIDSLPTHRLYSGPSSRRKRLNFACVRTSSTSIAASVVRRENRSPYIRNLPLTNGISHREANISHPFRIEVVSDLQQVNWNDHLLREFFFKLADYQSLKSSRCVRIFRKKGILH